MRKSLLWFSLIVPLFSQELTLQDAIETVLRNHPDVKSAYLRVQSSQASHNVEKSAYLPQIRFDANYNVTQTYVFPVPTNRSFNTIDDTGWNAGVYAKQKIWDFSQTSAKIDAKTKERRIAALSLEERKAYLAYRVKSLYGLMVVQNEAIQARLQDIKTKRAYYEQARALVEQGLKTDADANRFLSALYIAQANLAEAKASFQKAKNTLSLYMQRPIEENVRLEREVLYKTLPKDLNETEILRTNFELRIAYENIEKNALLHKSAHASHFGSIDAVASYTHIDTLNAYDAKTAGITVSIPLYSGGRVSAQTQQAKIATQIAKEQQAAQKLRLQEEIESLFIDIARYDATIEARRAQLQAARATQKVLNGRYEEGMSTYIEVLDATAVVLNAKLALLEAFYKKSIAIARLEYLKGRLQ